MKKSVLVTLFTLFCCYIFAQDINQDYKDALLDMLKSSGSEEAYQTAIDQMINMQKTQNPGIENEFWDKFSAEMKSSSLDDLTEMLVPVYQKYLTIEDLKEIVAFYQTPVGKKFANSNPMILQESMQVGQKWGMEMGRKIVSEIENQKN